MVQSISTGTFCEAKWVVDPTSGQGTHTTIATALTSASSGDTIFIRPGTYTENLTLKAGVNLTAYGSDSSLNATGKVIISGTCTLTTAGSVTIYGIQLQTNSAVLLAVTGSAASVVNLENCYLNCTNNTGITFSSSSASSAINISNCQGDLGTTGIAYFSHSSSGTMTIFNCDFSNSGGSSTANTVSAGSLFLRKSTFSNPTTTSGTAIYTVSNCGFSTLAQNVTSVTLGGSGAQSLSFCDVISGTATAISISSTAVIDNCAIASSNTSAISGAGTINMCGNVFTSTSSHVSVTTQTIFNEGPSKTIGSSNSGGTNTLTVTNSSNTASSAANILVTVAGSSAGDATHQSVVSGVTTWTWGIDNSVTSPTDDPWVLAQGTALGTNNVISIAKSGEINYPLQPAYLAYLANTATNKTGNGTTYTIGTDALTEVFDQNSDFNTNGTFTAPVTGRYKINCQVTISGTTIATTFIMNPITSNRTYQVVYNRAAAATDACLVFSELVDMDAADTHTLTITVQGEAGDTDDIAGNATVITSMSGYLVC